MKQMSIIPVPTSIQNNHDFRAGFILQDLSLRISPLWRWREFSAALPAPLCVCFIYPAQSD